MAEMTKNPRPDRKPVERTASPKDGVEPSALDSFLSDVDPWAAERALFPDSEPVPPPMAPAPKKAPKPAPSTATPAASTATPAASAATPAASAATPLPAESDTTTANRLIWGGVVLVSAYVVHKILS